MSDILERTKEAHEADERLLGELLAYRLGPRAGFRAPQVPARAGTISERIADRVAVAMGSWKFILAQSSIILVWVALNAAAYASSWDPYPFILLNLVLSVQAAYAAPMIMMSQNRQQEVDRVAVELDHRVNIEAELEIALLHQKMDRLREVEIQALVQEIRDLRCLLEKAGPAGERAS